MDPLKAISDETREAYRRAAHIYRDLFRDELDGKHYDRQLLDRFAARFGEGEPVLDAGCGPIFHIGRYLADRGVAVEGVDLSERCVALARELNPGAVISQGDFADLDTGDGRYQGVLSYYSIIHAPKREIGRFFTEFRRVLRPGGALLVVVKAGEGEGWMEDVLDTGARIWFSYFDEAEVEGYYREAGFEIEFMERRQPYDTEIENDRIYAIGVKA